MAETMTVQSKLATGMRFEVQAGSGHHITLDAAEHGGGDNEVSLRRRRHWLSPRLLYDECASWLSHEALIL